MPVCEARPTHRERIQRLISFKQLTEKASAINGKTWIWIGLGLAAAPALRIYYVQEMSPP